MLIEHAPPDNEYSRYIVGARLGISDEGLDHRDHHLTGLCSDYRMKGLVLLRFFSQVGFWSLLRVIGALLDKATAIKQIPFRTRKHTGLSFGESSRLGIGRGESRRFMLKVSTSTSQIQANPKP